MQVVGASDEPDFLEAEAGDLKIGLVVLVSLAEVVYLLQQDVRDHLHVCRPCMLAHLHQGVGYRLRLIDSTNIGLPKARLPEAAHVEGRFVSVATYPILFRVDHWRHLHVLLLAKAEHFDLGRDVKLDCLAFLNSWQ